MLSNGLAFAAKESSIQNNLSVVLLIEWKKRRLLFVGDAEWEGEFKEGKHNGSWNVMWEKHRKTHLKEPVDFLKIGHHGSINATPPPPSEQPQTKKAREPTASTRFSTRSCRSRKPARSPRRRRSSRPNASSTTRFPNASCWSTSPAA